MVLSGNGRTHEPSLRELTSQLDDLKEMMLEKVRAIRELLDERDRRYMELAKAQELAIAAALTAQKELTNQVFASSEKAIVKAENAQSSYNHSHNELARKMDDQYKVMMPRIECERTFSSLDSKVDDVKSAASRNRDELIKEVRELRESRSLIEGHGSGLSAGWGYLVGAIAGAAALLSIYSMTRGIP